MLMSDPKSFKITFSDQDTFNKEVEVEYTCEKASDCSEIVAKINYLILSKN